ncbi:unnamed protein product [Rangifer tarandus platyrhynchus]|uniref:Uncharacterized protein n=1 Tax=Rangifer tarandus platyrhynchus TaxID=3082113 RepID=A0ABN8XIX9_RANTA|nr:unnamed protein product [Rangifer tarandus platyrhynchus]
MGLLIRKQVLTRQKQISRLTSKTVYCTAVKLHRHSSDVSALCDPLAVTLTLAGAALSDVSRPAQARAYLRLSVPTQTDVAEIHA